MVKITFVQFDAPNGCRKFMVTCTIIGGSAGWKIGHIVCDKKNINSVHHCALQLN
jgi:hypothetical protein